MVGHAALNRLRIGSPVLLDAGEQGQFLGGWEEAGSGGELAELV